MRDGNGDAIVLNGVNKVDASKALRNVSLRVPVSSLYGIFGPANTGKTTLLRLIVGLERADSGVIRVCGLDAWHDRAVLRHRLAFMPTKFGDFPHVTIDEYLGFFEASFDIARSQRAQLTDELLELASLTNRRHDTLDQLSATEKQWLGLARCLIHDPDILVLDEPLAPIPESGRAAFTDMLVEWSRLGKTVVISASHSLEIEDVCTHIALMRDGSVDPARAVDTMKSHES